MKIIEIKQDLFTMSSDYALAHCISADFKLGAGIAKKFNELFDVRQRLFYLCDGDYIKDWDDGVKGDCLVIGVIDDPTIFNLITKRNYWDKPTLQTIENALKKMKIVCDVIGIEKVAMPRIGCGLDKQNWSDVKLLIEKVFEDTDIEIVVCSL